MKLLHGALKLAALASSFALATGYVWHRSHIEYALFPDSNSPVDPDAEMTLYARGNSAEPTAPQPPNKSWIMVMPGSKSGKMDDTDWSFNIYTYALAQIFSDESTRNALRPVRLERAVPPRRTLLPGSKTWGIRFDDEFAGSAPRRMFLPSSKDGMITLPRKSLFPADWKAWQPRK